MKNGRNFWFSELHTKDVGIMCRMGNTLHTEETAFQELDIIETEQFGRVLLLDGVIQTTQKDEYIYHEMISHIPMFTSNQPKRVLIIGGGDGGVVKEVLKHKEVEKVTVVEIDERVIEVSKEFLPDISYQLENEKVEIKITDGIKYFRNKISEFDVIIVDSLDPICSDEEVFDMNFYKKIYDALDEEGIVIFPTKSPYYHKEMIKMVNDDLKVVFPINKVFTCAIPSYSSGSWSFIVSSKKLDPEKIDNSKDLNIDTKYYTKDIHKSAFTLPKFLIDYLGMTKE